MKDSNTQDTNVLQDSDFTVVDYLTYFISIVSLTFSFLLIYTIKHTKELNGNVIVHLIVLLTISEMVNNVTQLSSFFATLLERQTDMLEESLRVCFFQIYCNLFSNIMTLLSSCLIAFHLFDALVYNNSFFSTRKIVSIAKVATLYLSLVLSLVFFIIHMEEFQNSDHIKYRRVISCWISGNLDYVLIGLYVILIIFICVVSNRAGKKLKEFRNELSQSGSNNSNDDRYGKVRLIQGMLCTYPFVTVLLYGAISVARILTYVSLNHMSENSFVFVVSSWLFAIAANFRGFLFVSVFLVVEKKIRERFVYFLCGGCCKGTKEDKEANLQMVEQSDDDIDDDCGCSCGCEDGAHLF